MDVWKKTRRSNLLLIDVNKLLHILSLPFTLLAHRNIIRFKSRDISIIDVITSSFKLSYRCRLAKVSRWSGGVHETITNLELEFQVKNRWLRNDSQSFQVRFIRISTASELQEGSLIYTRCKCLLTDYCWAEGLQKTLLLIAICEKHLMNSHDAGVCCWFHFDKQQRRKDLKRLFLDERHARNSPNGKNLFFSEGSSCVCIRIIFSGACENCVTIKIFIRMFSRKSRPLCMTLGQAVDPANALNHDITRLRLPFSAFMRWEKKTPG